jgi:hypothetical protein
LTVAVAAKPNEISPELWAEWLGIRKTKKQPLPTERALQVMTLEAGKAGISLLEAVTECCDRGWAGFKAEWYANSKTSAASTTQRQQENTFDQNGGVVEHSRQQAQPQGKMAQGLAALQALKGANWGAQS